jgi:hypothetical protein
MLSLVLRICLAPRGMCEIAFFHITKLLDQRSEFRLLTLACHLAFIRLKLVLRVADMSSRWMQLMDPII